MSSSASAAAKAERAERRNETRVAVAKTVNGALGMLGIAIATGVIFVGVFFAIIIALLILASLAIHGATWVVGALGMVWVVILVTLYVACKLAFT
jgi:hypothetical protein